MCVFLIAYEKLVGEEQNKLNASLTMNYDIIDNLKMTFRNGYDFYKNEDQIRNPAGINSTEVPSVMGHYWDFNGNGMYGTNQRWGHSINNVSSG